MARARTLPCETTTAARCGSYPCAFIPRTRFRTSRAGHDQSTRAYVGAFNFKGQDQQKNVGKLSGGERNRVNIAKMLKRGGNVLLLDEPTNDLDVETLGALEEAIENIDIGGPTLVRAAAKNWQHVGVVVPKERVSC